ncbi:UNVERIFIED_CONTAM: RING-H2 finger protein ATL74 [Sesamum latifolium]|uniref:RING-H2 finger protein ATL74 n=1 Tax=Sesamum latifolium TaxID=2727402 RepID=A0AAW2X9A4_9LAMI
MGSHVLGIATQVTVMAIVISVILLFLGIGVLILIHVCIVGRTLRRGLSERNVNMLGRGSFGSTSMSQDDIEKLPCFDFTAKEKGSGRGTSPPPDCAVCLENFRVGEKCRLLPSCNHSFHAECVDLWLLRTPICPICRAAADLIMRSGSSHEEESGSFGESGVELLRDIQMTETMNEVGNEIEVQIVGVGDFNGDEVGLNLNQTETGESVNLSETAIEVRERQEMGTGDLSGDGN